MKLRERWIPGQARNDRKELNLRFLRHSGLFSGYFAFFIRHSGPRAGIQFFLFFFFFLSIFSFPSQTHAATITRPSNGIGLIGYWTFDGKDMSPNVRDVSGNARHGNLQGQTSTTTINGKVGQALSFDGVDDYVLATDIPDNLPNMTISAWFKSNPVLEGNEYFPIISDITDLVAGPGFGLWLFSGGKVDFGVQDNGGSNYTQFHTTATFDDGTWHHVVATLSGGGSGTHTIYVDGVSQSLDNSSLGTVSDYSSALPVRISIQNGVSYLHPWNGELDDVRIYNRALSASEAKGLYNSGTAKISATKSPGTLASGLVGHWTFDGANMTPNVRDVSGQGNHGNLQGQTSTSTVIGKIGQAFSFDGTDDRISIPDVVAANPITFCTWYFTNSPTFGTFLLNNNKFSLYVSTLNRFGVSSDGVAEYLSPIDAIKSGEWTHLCISRNASGDITMYTNAVVDSTGSSGTPTVSGSGLAIGNHSFTNNAWNGYMDDVRIYNRVLSASEIKQIYALGGSKQNVSKNKTGGSLDSSLALLWSFDGKDVTDKIYDRSGNGYHAYYYGGATTTAIGKIGQALNFDGVSEYTSVDVNISSANWSWSFWSKYEGGSGYVAALNTSPRVILSAAGDFNLYRDPIGWVSAVSGVITPGWHHIVVVGTASTIKAYIDGVLQVDEAGAPDYSAATQTLLIGFNPNFSAYYGGSVDDVRIYRKSLSASEVKQLYNMGR